MKKTNYMTPWLLPVSQGSTEVVIRITTAAARLFRVGNLVYDYKLSTKIGLTTPTKGLTAFEPFSHELQRQLRREDTVMKYVYVKISQIQGYKQRF